MEFTLDPLPFAEDALEPHISKRTVNVHYKKHHQGYMNKLNEALKRDDPRREQDLEEIVKNSDGKVFNLAAQVWNHSFYWNSLSPSSTTAPSAELSAQIDKDFGDLDSLQSELKSVGTAEFGSGWVWLLWQPDAKKLKVSSTTDAKNPLGQGVIPLLTIDVWEHAYYLDYQNARGDYLSKIIENLLNWEFANLNFASN